MAKKSKTQRAKASAARAQRKQEREQASSQAEQQAIQQDDSEDKPKRSLFKKKDSEDQPEKDSKANAKNASDSKAMTKAKKNDGKPKKARFQFFKDVKAEMKRVTWPSRSDVIRWTGVVIAALVFFGVFVAVLDNLIITPILVFISGIGA